MDEGTGMMQAPSSPAASDEGHPQTATTMHMTFFWGKNVQILFAGWPGGRGVGAYLLALILVFAVSAAAECLSVISKRLNPQHGGRARGRVSTSLLLTGVHAVETGLHYLVMLAVMSFNVAVLIAAVAGHAVGFLVAGSGLLLRTDSSSGGQLNLNERDGPNPKV